MTVAMILAAGLGTRLRPLTDELPKPLVPVGDAPLVVQIQRHLAAHGIGRIVMNTHHRHEAFDAITFPLPTTTSFEPDILGTAGGVAGARPHFDAHSDDDVLVWNGDILGAIDVSALIDRHAQAREASGTSATWVVAPRERNEGNVGLNANGFVVRVRDFRRAHDASHASDRGGHEVSSADFLGIQMLSAKAIAALPEKGCLIGDALGPQLVDHAHAVATVVHSGRWFDIGTPVAYLAANLAWLSDRGLEQLDLRGEQHGAADAGVEHTTLTKCIIGARATLVGQGCLDRVVVWPGATAHAPLTSAIVTPHHVVHV